MKVSVCVSFYNAEAFVQRCLDMLCAQTLKELEIVLVNDGSKDNTLELMRRYSKEHSDREIRIVNQENKSLCQARLTGVNNAIGEYVTFVDQDDLIDKFAYEKMYNCAVENDVDIVEIKTRHGDEIIGCTLTGRHDSHEVLRKYLNGEVQMKSMLWLRLYRRSLFKKPVLPALYTNNEDVFGLPCLLYAAQSLFFLPETLHTYSVDNAESFMASLKDPSKSKKRFASRRIALKVPAHFESFVGEEGMAEYEFEFKTFKATNIFDFLKTNIYNISLTDKIEAVLEDTDFKSAKDLKHFLRDWLPKNAITYKVYRILGLGASLYFYRMSHKSQ